MRFLGVNDDITTCELCGKSNLKRTVALETESGAIVHYGCDCAAKSLKSKTNKLNTRDVNQIADMVAVANDWLTRHSLEKVAQGIWNRYGYLYEVKNDVLRIKTSVGYIELKKGN